MMGYVESIISFEQSGLMAYSLISKLKLGCMTETSIGISAAAQFVPLVDWCDLDGNLLIDNEICGGAKMIDGKLNWNR